MDLDGFNRMFYPDLPPVSTEERPVMLSVDADDVLDEIQDEQVREFIIGLAGILSECFNIPADGDEGMNEKVAFALSGSPMMFGEALPDENEMRIDQAQRAIRQAQKLGTISKDISVFLSLTIR